MTKEKKHLPPASLLALDLVGTVLLGLGIFEWVSGSNLVSEPFQFSNYPVAMVIIGGLMMLPALLHVINFARGGKGGRPRDI